MSCFLTLPPAFVEISHSKQNSKIKARNTWWVWPLQHRRNFGRLWPRCPGSLPSPCRSGGRGAPGGPPLPLPARSPSRNTVVQSWTRAEGWGDKRHPPQKMTPTLYFWLFFFGLCLFLAEWEKKRSLTLCFPFFPSEKLSSPPLSLRWVRVWVTNRL